jgi:putative transposase
VLGLLRGRFVDAAPAQAWATLLDERTYLASESTVYRLLRASGETKERRHQPTHPPRTIPELVAERPNQVWPYDVTKLKGPRRGVHFDPFMMLDIYSRYCPGWMVVDQEDGRVAKAWISEVVASQHVQPHTLTVHADRGSTMTSKPVARLLSDLRIGRTHSRP